MALGFCSSREPQQRHVLWTHRFDEIPEIELPAEMMKLARLAGATAFHHECDLSLHRAVEFVDRAAARVTAAFRGHSTCIIFLVVRAGGAESSSNAAVYREPTWPSETDGRVRGCATPDKECQNAGQGCMPHTC
jgi:hypothetical protein